MPLTSKEAKSFEARFSSLASSFVPEEFHEARPSSNFDDALHPYRPRESMARQRSATLNFSAPRLRLPPSTDALHNKGVMLEYKQRVTSASSRPAVTGKVLTVCES